MIFITCELLRFYLGPANGWVVYPPESAMMNEQIEEIKRDHKSRLELHSLISNIKMVVNWMFFLVTMLAFRHLAPKSK